MCEDGGYEALGALVHDSGPLTVFTSRGPVICLDEVTYARLLPAVQAPPSTRELIPRPAPMTCITPSLADTNPDAAVPTVQLSTGEVQLLRALANGESTAEVADRVGLALNTVAQHLATIRRKYCVRTTAAAVLAAGSEGQLQSDCSPVWSGARADD